MKPAKAISDLRRWLRLTQAEMAEACGVSRVTVARWESGAAKPSDWLWDVLSWRVARRPFYRGQDAQEGFDYERAKAFQAMKNAIRRWSKRGRKRILHPRYHLLSILVGLGPPISG